MNKEDIVIVTLFVATLVILLCLDWKAGVFLGALSLIYLGIAALMASFGH